eukprot:46291-Prorocentrum_minimum.AAC.2
MEKQDMSTAPVSTRALKCSAKVWLGLILLASRSCEGTEGSSTFKRDKSHSGKQKRSNASVQNITTTARTNLPRKPIGSIMKPDYLELTRLILLQAKCWNARLSHQLDMRSPQGFGGFRILGSLTLCPASQGCDFKLIFIASAHLTKDHIQMVLSRCCPSAINYHFGLSKLPIEFAPPVDPSRARCGAASWSSSWFWAPRRRLASTATMTRTNSRTVLGPPESRGR